MLIVSGVPLCILPLWSGTRLKWICWLTGLWLGVAFISLWTQMSWDQLSMMTERVFFLTWKLAWPCKMEDLYFDWAVKFEIGGMDHNVYGLWVTFANLHTIRTYNFVLWKADAEFAFMARALASYADCSYFFYQTRPKVQFRCRTKWYGCS